MYIAILCISAVAICTERVEAKITDEQFEPLLLCCNLHGACGGKDHLRKDTGNNDDVAICTERVEAKQGKATRKGVKGALQSARSV